MSELYIIRHIESGAVRQMGEGVAAVFYRRDAAEKYLSGLHGYKIQLLRLHTQSVNKPESQAASEFLKNIFGKGTSFNE